MDKFLLQQQVLERLAQDLMQAEQAMRAAHETATHEENIAENKYDTLGLEAAYLATGQARRADAIRQAIAHWRQFRPLPYDASKGIQLGALVCLLGSDDKEQQLFLGPGGGSMKLISGTQLVQVVSSDAPLGRAMLGKCEGDAVSIEVAPVRQQPRMVFADVQHDRPRLEEHEVAVFIRGDLAEGMARATCACAGPSRRWGSRTTCGSCRFPK